MEKKLNAHIEWQNHNNKKVLFINFQYCSDAERIAISKIAVAIIAGEAFNSVRVLFDVRNTEISIESMRVTKKEWMDVGPNILKIAFIGVTGIKSMMLKLSVNMTNFKMKPFSTTDEGILYLCR